MKKLLIIENILGKFKITPILFKVKHPKPLPILETCDEEDISLYAKEFFMNPYAAMFAFQVLKQQRIKYEDDPCVGDC